MSALWFLLLVWSADVVHCGQDSGWIFCIKILNLSQHTLILIKSLMISFNQLMEKATTKRTKNHIELTQPLSTHVFYWNLSLIHYRKFLFSLWLIRHYFAENLIHWTDIDHLDNHLTPNKILLFLNDISHKRYDIQKVYIW